MDFFDLKCLTDDELFDKIVKCRERLNFELHLNHHETSNSLRVYLETMELELDIRRKLQASKPTEDPRRQKADRYPINSDELPVIEPPTKKRKK